MNQLPKLFSIVLHPLLMPTYIVLILFNSNLYIGFNPPEQIKIAVYILVFLNTFLLPSALSYYMLKNKYIKTLEMESNKERRIPYLITSVFFILTYYLLQKFNLSVLLHIIMLGASGALLLTMLINYAWKISAHMVGIGGLVGVLLGLAIRLQMDFKILLFVFILLAGFLGTSRLFLKAHTPAQVYLGFFVGVFCQLALFLLL